MFSQENKVKKTHKNHSPVHVFYNYKKYDYLSGPLRGARTPAHPHKLLDSWALGSPRGSEYSRTVGKRPPGLERLRADFWAEAPRPLVAPVGIAGRGRARSSHTPTNHPRPATHPFYKWGNLRPGQELGWGPRIMNFKVLLVQFHLQHFPSWRTHYVSEN